ncbi:MAG: helix-hairpin-helix domain-containing protein [Actinomycetota bacterium]
MDGGIRDWLSGLSRRELVLVALVGLMVVGGAGLWYARSMPQPLAVRAEPAPEAAATPSPAVLFVHVAGWVKAPGVYELREGARVIDAVQMAGGPRRGAELGALNLAAPLTDGQQVIVPRVLPNAPPGAPPAAASGAPPSTGSADGGPVNINTATADQLEALPGIGPVLAQRIIDFREKNGPFSSVDQLEDVSGIGPVTMEGLRDLVTI